MVDLRGQEEGAPAPSSLLLPPPPALSGADGMASSIVIAPLSLPPQAPGWNAGANHDGQPPPLPSMISGVDAGMIISDGRGVDAMLEMMSHLSSNVSAQTAHANLSLEASLPPPSSESISNHNHTVDPMAVDSSVGIQNDDGGGGTMMMLARAAEQAAHLPFHPYQHPPPAYHELYPHQHPPSAFSSGNHSAHSFASMLGGGMMMAAGGGPVAHGFDHHHGYVMSGGGIGHMHPYDNNAGGYGDGQTAAAASLFGGGGGGGEDPSFSFSVGGGGGGGGGDLIGNGDNNDGSHHSFARSGHEPLNLEGIDFSDPMSGLG